MEKDTCVTECIIVICTTCPPMTGDYWDWLPLAAPHGPYSAGPACFGLYYSLGANLSPIHDPNESTYPPPPSPD